MHVSAGVRGLRRVTVAATLAALLLLPAGGAAHIFLKRSEPADGAMVGEPPATVRLWFDGPVEPLFVTLRIENRDKQQVDKRDARVSAGDPSLVEVGVPRLPPGRYRVFWSVVARDGHPKDGHFAFRVK